MADNTPANEVRNKIMLVGQVRYDIYKAKLEKRAWEWIEQKFKDTGYLSKIEALGSEGLKKEISETSEKIESLTRKIGQSGQGDLIKYRDELIAANKMNRHIYNTVCNIQAKLKTFIEEVRQQIDSNMKEIDILLAEITSSSSKMKDGGEKELKEFEAKINENKAKIDELNDRDMKLYRKIDFMEQCKISLTNGKPEEYMTR